MPSRSRRPSRTAWPPASAGRHRSNASAAGRPPHPDSRHLGSGSAGASGPTRSRPCGAHSSPRLPQSRQAILRQQPRRLRRDYEIRPLAGTQIRSSRDRTRRQSDTPPPTGLPDFSGGRRSEASDYKQDRTVQARPHKSLPCTATGPHVHIRPRSSGPAVSTRVSNRRGYWEPDAPSALRRSHSLTVSSVLSRWPTHCPSSRDVTFTSGSKSTRSTSSRLLTWSPVRSCSSNSHRKWSGTSGRWDSVCQKAGHK